MGCPQLRSTHADPPLSRNLTISADLRTVLEDVQRGSPLPQNDLGGDWGGYPHVLPHDHGTFFLTQGAIESFSTFDRCLGFLFGVISLLLCGVFSLLVYRLSYPRIIFTAKYSLSDCH